MNTDKKELHRGEIYICDFVDVGGSVQNGLRPALVIQNDVGNKFSTTVIVSPITSIIKKDKLPTHIYLGTEYKKICSDVLKIFSLFLTQECFISLFATSAERNL